MRLVSRETAPAGRLGTDAIAFDSERGQRWAVDRRALLSLALATAAIGPRLPASAAAANQGAGWDLRDLYPTEQAWTADFKRVGALIPQVAAFKGRLGESADVLLSALRSQSTARRVLARLAVYANAKAAEDTSDAAAQSRARSVRQLAGRLGTAAAFTGPEVVKLGRTRLESFAGQEKRLAPFRTWIDDFLRLSAHTLSEESEAVIAATAIPFGGSLAVVNQMNASDIPRPTVTLSDGRRVVLDEQGSDAEIDNPNRADRKLVFEGFFGSLKPFEATLGVDLLAQVQQEVFTAQVRRYPTALDAALDQEAIPVAVYRTFVREVNAGLPAFQRYLRLRGRLLGVSRLQTFDLYAPLASDARRYSLSDMRANLFAAVRPLGAEYVATLARATTARWTDPWPRPKKQPGNYNDPGAYDVHPYLLFNLSSNYDSITNYAHEWGHAMHSVLTAKAQPYETSIVSSFIAEVPSQLNEILLVRHMAGNASTDWEALFYKIQELELWSGHFYKAGLGAEFQDAIHAPVESGDTLTGDGLSATYLSLMRRYYGDAVDVAPLYGIGWARNYQFWEGYYTFQYGTCITAAGGFADLMLSGDEAARQAYIALLRAGGSQHAYELLRRAGMDLATPEPYRRVVSSFDHLVEQAEIIADRLSL